MKYWIAFLIPALLIFLSCDSGSSSDYSPSVENEALSPASAKQSLPLNGRKIITSGDIRFEVADLPGAEQYVRELMLSHGGFLDEERKTEGKRQTINYWTVRIPSDTTDAFVLAVEKQFAPLDRKNISARDVTEEFIDVEARLKTRKALEQRFLELLNRANEINEMIRLERELSEVRGEIESMEQRVKVLDNRSSYSTIQLEFYVEKTPARRFFEKAGENFVRGWDLFLGFLIGLVAFWPFFLLFGLLYVLWRRYRKK